MAIDPHRLLGLAFASADLLLEIDAEGVVSLAVGASESISGRAATQWLKHPWRELADPADHAMLASLFNGLESGQRAGPVVVRMAGGDGKAASVCAFRVPENAGAISCALSLASADAAAPDGKLHIRQSFESLALGLLNSVKSSGEELELAMIELDGLSAAREAVAPELRQALEASLDGVLRAQAYGGAAVTELGDQRFAMVRHRGESQDALLQRIARLIQADGGHEVKPAADIIALKGGGDGQHAARALRYCLDSFLTNGPQSPAPADLSEALQRAMQKTLDAAGELAAIIRNGDFYMIYQPVMMLETGAVHHHEALVRFGSEGSPFPKIRMAEEMELIEELDLAIVERAVQMLSRDPKLKIAVNVSGRTMGGDRFYNAVKNLTDRYPRIRGRLMLELTESAALEDMVAAEARLKALSALDCEICLDDFGAGAASFAYLQQLSIDLLKIDGRYIRELQHGTREATFVKHLVSMCNELGVRTLAEMVETPEAENAVRRAGVDMAQGWLYGAGTETPQAPAGNNHRIRPALTR